MIVTDGVEKPDLKPGLQPETIKRKDHGPPGQGVARRSLLAAGVAALSAAGGVAFGFKEDDRLASWRRSLMGGARESAVSSSFRRDAIRIRAAHEKQTIETVKTLKAKYEGALFGRVRVWEMVEKLALCVDPTDDALLLSSQYVHVEQILERMETDGEQDRDLIVTALLHDLGKVMLLTTEAPEHIVCFTKPIGDYPRNIGLDNVIVQFGHDEMIYSRLKDYVPERIAWTIRYHSAYPESVEPYLSEHERANNNGLLEKFRAYDQGSKSSRHLPRVDMRKYRDLIEDLFPKPILI